MSSRCTSWQNGGGDFKFSLSGIAVENPKKKLPRNIVHYQNMKSVNLKLFSILTDQRTGARTKQLVILHSWNRRGVQIHKGNLVPMNGTARDAETKWCCIIFTSKWSYRKCWRWSSKNGRKGKGHILVKNTTDRHHCLKHHEVLRPKSLKMWWC